MAKAKTFKIIHRGYASTDDVVTPNGFYLREIIVIPSTENYNNGHARLAFIFESE